MVLLFVMMPALALADEPLKLPPDAEAARKACATALNAYPDFAGDVVGFVNQQTKQQHLDAAQAIAKNERHVILAYAAMWVIAAGFVVFLWRRQQRLKAEIAMLRRDLDAAVKDAR
jgi:hypothetical protein